MNKAPIFILGCGRSGTSLLSRILDHHPEVAVPYESHYFHTFFPLFTRYGDLSNESNLHLLIRHILKTGPMRMWQPRLTEEDVFPHIKKHDFGGIFEGLMTAYMAIEGKSLWAEKTPHHVNFISTIIEYFPRARFIHIVRDGRDVAVSFRQARFGPKTIYGVGRLWKSYLEKYKSQKRYIPSRQRFELRYEDLISQPEKSLKNLCDFLEIDYCESMMQFYKNTRLYNTDKVNAANLMKPIMSNNAYKWKNILQQKEVLLFEKLAGQNLIEHSYEIVSKDLRPLSMKEALTYKFIKEPFKRNMARLKDFHGQRSAIIKFTIYFELFWKKRFDKLGAGEDREGRP